MTTLATKAKLLLAPMVAATLCVGLLAAGMNAPQPDAPLHPTRARADEPKPPEPKPAIAPDRVGAGEPGTVAGRVVGPDGKPVAGATVVWRQRPSHNTGLTGADPAELYPAAVTGKTDAEGKFKLDVVIRGRTPFRTFNPWGNLTAVADGFGPAASHTGDIIHDKWNQAIELKLAKTDVPIEGRLIDLEGKPVAGVTVRPVIAFFNLAGDLGPWLKSATGSGNPPDRHQVGIAIPADDLKFSQSATSDKDGRFKLAGLGDERVVGLRLDGGGIETHYIQVMTRAGETVTITNQLAWHPSVGPKDVYPAKFTHAVAPGRTIRGTVTAADTGKPLAGVQVSIGAPVEGSTIPPIRVVAVTDQDGNYRLTGYPRQTPYWLRFAPPADQPYVALLGAAPRREDGDPAVVDMKLPRGVFVSGTVTDKLSSKPLAAVVAYHPHKGNPNLGGRFPVSVQVACDPKDGSYKLVALLGDGLVAAKISDPYRGAYIPGVGADSVSWYDKAKDSFQSANFGFRRDHYDAYAGIAPKPDAGPLKVDLKLEPAASARVRLLDPDGKPLAGCEVWPVGQPGRHVPGDRATFHGIDPKKATVGFATHAKRNLVCAFTLPAGEADEIAVKLQPAAVVTARLIDDSDGTPLADTVVVGYVHANEKVSGSFFGKSGKDGKLRVEMIPAGASVTGQVQHFNGREYKIIPVFEKLTLKPGETRELGDIRLRLNDE